MKKQLSRYIQQDLENRILLNHLQPGDQLSEVDLSEQYRVSRTPVRQALQQLAARGLVEIRDGAGSFVTPVSLRQMGEAYQIRREMEKLALCTSIDRIGAEELDALEREFSDYARLIREGAELPHDKIAFADWRLHDLIINKSDNHLIAPTVEKITLILRRYQIANISGYERATREHLAIIDGIRRRDLQGVTTILDEHLKFRSIQGKD